MTRDRDLDALAEAIRQAQGTRQVTLPHALVIGLARLSAWTIRKATPFALFSIAAGVLLARTGASPGWLLMAMFYGSPAWVIGVVVFTIYAVRQNTGTTYTSPAGQEVGQAEPGQVADQVGQPAQDVEVGQVARVAKPAPPATVTVTVLPTPVAELTQSPTRPGQGDTVYPTVPEEEIA